MPVAFVGRLSEDDFGNQLAAALRADGVSLELATFGPEPTTVAHAEVDGRGTAGYRFELDGTSAPNLTPQMLPSALPRAVRAIHVGSLGLALEPIGSTLLGLVERERAGRLTMLDPNVRTGIGDETEHRRRLQAMIPASTIVKASASDVAWLYPDAGPATAVQRMLAAGVGVAVITLGKDGALGAHRDLRVHVAAPPVEVVDTIGAGDAFGAGMLARLHELELIRPELRLDEPALRSVLQYACVAASITCSRAGADPPWKQEVVALEGWRGSRGSP